MTISQMLNTQRPNSKFATVERMDAQRGDVSDQPPDDWPPVNKNDADAMKRMADYKDSHSPLTWPFTEEQNRRKLQWLQRINNSKLENMTQANFVKSFVVHDIIRRDWYTVPELKRTPKLGDLYLLVHPDKAAAIFQNEAAKFGMSWQDIEKLHQDVFSSTSNYIFQISWSI